MAINYQILAHRIGIAGACVLKDDLTQSEKDQARAAAQKILDDAKAEAKKAAAEARLTDAGQRKIRIAKLVGQAKMITAFLLDCAAGRGEIRGGKQIVNHSTVQSRRGGKIDSSYRKIAEDLRLELKQSGVDFSEYDPNQQGAKLASPAVLALIQLELGLDMIDLAQKPAKAA